MAGSSNCSAFARTWRVYRKKAYHDMSPRLRIHRTDRSVSLYLNQREFARAQRSLAVACGAYSFAIVLESVGEQYVGKLEGG